MRDSNIDESNPVITGLFAHYCGPWEYERFTRELFAQRGYDMLNPDLPIDDPDATEDDFAATIREKQQERGAAEYVDLGHSFGCDLIYRKLGAAPVSMLIFVGGPLRKVAENAGIPRDLNSHSLLYHALAKAEEAGQADFEKEREMIGRKLFSDLGDKALQAWATEQLRPHPHKKNDDAIDENAKLDSAVAMHYVGLRYDHVYFYASQQQLLKNLKDKSPDLPLGYSSIPTGHFPMLQKPELFVDHIVGIIEDEKQKKLAAGQPEQAVTNNRA
jgi:pimeloyl-ACP methyl ester carboxylesterase